MPPQHYNVRIKGKVGAILGKKLAPYLTIWCSIYRKVSLRVTLDYGGKLYFKYIYIYTYVL